MNTQSTTWRDFADRLTPEQIAEMELCEAQQIPPGIYSPEAAINVAQAHIRSNEAQKRFASISVPADAVDVAGTWTDYEDGVWCRPFWSSTRTISSGGDAVTVRVSGWQYSTGAVERHVFIDGDGLEQLTTVAARALASAILEAADEVDRLNGDSPPFM